MNHDQPREEPFSEANLDSPEYRERLMRKLNCLIAVLEVATAKVRKSLAAPAGDTERLSRIKTNLQSTLDVCLRARAALERREALPVDLPENLSQVIREAKDTSVSRSGAAKAESPAVRRSRVEMQSSAEAAKFARLGPIDPRMVAGCDLEQLSRELQA
jgi:hypothetical protein